MHPRPAIAAGSALLGLFALIAAAGAQTPQAPASPPAPAAQPAAAQNAAPQAVPPAAGRPAGAVRGAERRRRTYASCNRLSQARGLRGGVRRRFLIRCKLGYERPKPVQPALPQPQPPARQP